MTTIDCEDSYSASGLWPFEPPAIIDVERSTYRVLLCVHLPGRRMRLYVSADA